MTIYVAIDLANEAYCDGCVCLHSSSGSYCEGMRVEIEEGLAEVKGYIDRHYIRPQACIDASAEIECAVGMVKMGFAPYDGDIEGGE